MDLRGSEYFKICGSAWNFFKESLPARNDQSYWDNIIEKGGLITQAYKNTKYYCFAIRQVIDYIDELETLSHTSDVNSLSGKSDKSHGSY